jgi:hypothetical protein
LLKARADVKNADKTQKASKAAELSVSAPEKLKKDELSDADLAEVSGGLLTPEKVEAAGENIRRVK